MSIDIIFKISAIGILVAIITLILKKSGKDDIATVVSIVGLIIVLTLVVDVVTDFFNNIKNIFSLF